MPTPITMPQLGESVTEGTVVKWLKLEGERVELDEPLFEITTDKVNAEMPSPVAGVLARRVVAEGAVVPVGSVVAEIEQDIAAVKCVSTSPNLGPDHDDQRTSIDAGTQSKRQGQDNDQLTNNIEQLPAPFGEKRRYSPVVRHLASEHSIDLTAIDGTGINGRVTKEDVLAFLSTDTASLPARVGASDSGSALRVTRDSVLRHVGQQANGSIASYDVTEPLLAQVAPVRTAAGANQILPTTDDVHVPLSPARRAIAEHMVRSKNTAPHATTIVEVDMSRLVYWRAAHKESFRLQHQVDITYVSFVAIAVAEALRRFPQMNASWGVDHIVLRQQVNLGIAVGLEEALLVPVIHGADGLSLVGMARAISSLVHRTRAGKLAVSDLQGGTFTLNNTGAFGSIASTPVINQPQAGILSMEAIVKRPVVIDDAIAIRSIMNLCLSFDHRVVDGLLAGRFNHAVKSALEAAKAVPYEGLETG